MSANFLKEIDRFRQSDFSHATTGSTIHCMKTGEAPRILVIDDNAPLRSSLASALESVGYNVRTGSDGHQGVAIAREFKPEVVVCDMHMPHASGSSVLSALRQDDHFALSQFVLMTGDLDGTPQRAGMDMGADDYLAKPFTMDEFLNCVSVRLKRSQLYKKAEDRAVLRLQETIAGCLPHEIFTPLTGILGFTEVLREEIGHVSPAEAEKMVVEIHLSAERLYRTLKNYLRMLDVLNERSPPRDTGEMTASGEVLNVMRTAARSVVERFRRQDDFTLDCAPVNVPLSAADLSTLIVELVDNGCKYSLDGAPVLARLKGTPDEIRLTVSDRGRGMGAEQIAQIGAFRQFDRKRYEQQGLGLGLTLAQYLVGRSGGTFHLKSAPDAGTTITATWPRLNR